MGTRESNESTFPTPRQRGQACERCWKQKKKCDKVIPACTNCIAVDAECVPRNFASGPIAGTGNLSHATVPSYVETLKRKRDELEGQVQRQRARLQQDEQHQPPRSPANRTEHPQSDVDSGLQDVADTTVQAAMGEVGLLSRSAMAEPRDEMSGFSQELAMGRMVRATLAISGKDPTKSTTNPHSAIVLDCDQTTSLARDISMPYVTLFIESIEPQFLHLRESRIWEDFETYFREPSDEFRSSGKGRVVSFNVYMNTAVGMLLSPDSTSLQGLASSLQAIAMRMFAGILDSGSRFDILHCMLSLIIYSMQTSLGGSTWHLLGLAMQKAITFGFYKDPNPAHSLPIEQLKDRRDIFWGLYTMDRAISTIMDRPFNIEDNDIHVLPPDQYATAESGRTNHVACQIVDYARLVSTIRNSSSQEVIFHYNNLCYWNELVSASELQVKMSHRCIQQLSCRAMCQILKSKGSKGMGESLITSSRNIETDFIRNCREYIEEEYQRSENGELTGTFIDAYDIFAAGVVVICLTRDASSFVSAPEIVHKCTVTLALLVERFPALRIFRRVLSALSAAALGSSPYDKILDELPDVVPEGIRNLIMGVIS